MKDFYKKILPLFGVSCCFLPNKDQHLLKSLKNSEEIIIKAKLKKVSKQKDILQKEKSKQLKFFIDKLNQVEIYLLVTDPIQEKIKQDKMNKQILLLLHTEERLNSEQILINKRHEKFCFLFGRGEDIPSTEFSFDEVVDPEDFPVLAKAFRNGKSYYVNNLGGYKSICPVFFDKGSAQDFLHQMYTETENVTLEHLPSNYNKEIYQGISKTKIIAVGLGDFIDYYCSDEHNNTLEKVEFLFVPNLIEQETLSKEKNMNGALNKMTYKNVITFKSCQKNYYRLKLKYD